MKDWLDKLAETPTKQAEEPPKGFFNTREIAKRRGFTMGGAARWMTREIKAGRARRVYVKRLASDGKLAIVPYYGPA